jgi:hypothetical protein
VAVGDGAAEGVGGADETADCVLVSAITVVTLPLVGFEAPSAALTEPTTNTPPIAPALNGDVNPARKAFGARCSGLISCPDLRLAQPGHDERRPNLW